jgi:hypothetical protein
MPKPTAFVVSTANYLLKEKPFLLTAVGVFAVFTLFTAPLFSMVLFTKGGFAQLVDGDNPYYFMQQTFAQELTPEPEITTEEPQQPPTTAQEPEPEAGETVTTPPTITEQQQPPTTNVTTPPTITEQQQPPTNATALPPTINQTNQTAAAADCKPYPGSELTRFGAQVFGNVFNDINGDGMSTPSLNEGIAGVTVTLEPTSKGAEVVVGSGKSDRFGNYFVSGARNHSPMGQPCNITFNVIVTPPPTPPRLPEVEPPPEQAEQEEPFVLELITPQTVTITYDDFESSPIQNVNFVFRQVPCIPEVTRCP